MRWVQFKRGDDRCRHTWGDEESDNALESFMWSRTCTQCGEKRTTRMLNRGATIEVSDWVNGVSYVIGSAHNLANTEFRYLKCDCGNSVRVEFELSDDGRVERKSAVACEWCGATFPVGSRGPDHGPRGAFWLDAPEVK